MNPREGALKQIEIYRSMTGPERLRIGFELWELSLALMRSSERNAHPELSDGEIDGRVKERIRIATAGSSAENRKKA